MNPNTISFALLVGKALPLHPKTNSWTFYFEEHQVVAFPSHCTAAESFSLKSFLEARSKQRQPRTKVVTSSVVSVFFLGANKSKWRTKSQLVAKMAWHGVVLPLLLLLLPQFFDACWKEKRLTANSFWQFWDSDSAPAAAVVHSWLQFLYTAEEEGGKKKPCPVPSHHHDTGWERISSRESGPERDQSRAIIDRQRFRKEDLWGGKKTERAH